MNDSYPGTRLRAFRIEDKLYERTRDNAKAAGVSLSAIVREAFERFNEEAEK